MVSILFEDKHCLVINKPAGISVHGDGKVALPTISDWMLEKYPESASVGEPFEIENVVIPRPGIVHRLDKETSGCLIIAKTQESFLNLKKQFQDHTVEKIYHAWVYGVPKQRAGIIDVSIGRSSSDIRKWATGRGARGTMREAVTEYTVLEAYGVSDETKGSTESGTYAYIEARPRTGRTHQIRVHMKYLNHPIIADSLYAPLDRHTTKSRTPEGKPSSRPQELGFTRLALHAYCISFTDMSGTRQTIMAPLPEDFLEAEKFAKTHIMC